MKLVTYRHSGAEHVGALTPDGSGILPLPVPDMNTLIETMDLPALRSAVAAAERGSALALSEAELLAPIPRPRQDVVCLGMNYRAHEEESARYNADAFTKETPAAVYFSKRVSEAGRPGGVIPRHAGLTDRLDYEAELGAKPLGEFVREIVGLDMNAAKEAFSQYLDDTNLDSRQIYFVNQIVEYIVHNGMMKDLSVLQEPPFTDQGSIVEVFTDLTLWAGIKGVIDRINANAAA